MYADGRCARGIYADYSVVSILYIPICTHDSVFYIHIYIYILYINMYAYAIVHVNMGCFHDIS